MHEMKDVGDVCSEDDGLLSVVDDGYGSRTKGTRKWWWLSQGSADNGKYPQSHLDVGL
jgi:hypothetical protein